MPPPPLGSGKFGTPCERMQLEYFSPAAAKAVFTPPDAARAETPEDPHAAIAAHAMAANAST